MTLSLARPFDHKATPRIRSPPMSGAGELEGGSADKPFRERSIIAGRDARATILVAEALTERKPSIQTGRSQDRAVFNR